LLTLRRTAFLMMLARSLVQTKGVGCSFQWAMYTRMCRSNAGSVSKDPRRTERRVGVPNQASTMLSQDAPVGVK